MRTLVIAVSVAALLLVAAGCGGSSSSADDSTTAIETTDATATDTSDSTDTSGGTDTSSGSDTTDSDEDVSLAGCEELGELSAKYTEALGAATAGGKVDLEATAKAYEDFADEVPEEIRDAFKTVAAAFGEYADILKDVDLSAGETPDPDKLAEIAEAMQKLDNAELTAASAEIEAWAKKNCSTGG